MSFDSTRAIERKNYRRAWAITLIGSLFFFYGFIQVNMLTPMASALQSCFMASAQEIGLLSAFFFYSNVLFLLPAGLILDRFPIKKVMLFNLVLAIIGSLIFARSSSLPMAAFSRFISGIMMSFGLIACLKLASLWLPPARLALASSLIVTIGMFGAAAAQTSVTFLVGAFDWRYATMFIAGAGGLITVIIGFFVKQSAPSAVSAPSQGVFQSLREAAKEPQNWLCGTFIATINLPVAILGALFGVTYLTSTYGVSAMQGATIVAMLFTGMICGSPFFGFISDRLKKRKMLVLSGGAACLVLMLMVMYLPGLGSVALHLLFFGVGFTSACQVLGYPMIAEANPPANTGTALSLAAILIMGGGYGLGLPFVGYLLDMNWGSAAAAYQHAFLSIPIGIAIGLVAAIFAKDP